MPISRRELLKRACLTGATLPLGGVLARCGGDGGDGDAGPDVAADVGTDHGADALADAAEDVPPEVDDAGPDVPEEVEEEPLPEYEYDGEPGPEYLFEHGVASGDPLPTAVILWTRVSAGASAEDPSSPDAPEAPDSVDVFWEVALDPDFEDRVAADWTTAAAERDHTAKVDAGGLSPDTSYFYRFRALGRTSPVARTRTAPRGDVDRLRFAVCSCSNYSRGWFVGYREMAAMPGLSAVIHLGDYIYEGGEHVVRAHDPPHELRVLADYRRRYSQYRRDPDLQEAHRQHPFIPVWDDHESSNNAWEDGAANHDPASDGPWESRVADAVRAWHEWQPVRETWDRHIYRTLRYGDLVDLVMLDTRLWGRDRQVEDASDVEALEDPDRTIMGFDQEAWLAEELALSEARWTVIGQQVMLGQLQFNGVTFNPDQWDGYEASRQRLFDAVEAGGVRNLVVLTGDIHSSWASDLIREPEDDVYDPETGEGTLGVEVVVPGVTSPFPKAYAQYAPVAINVNDHVRWADVSRKGFAVLDVTRDRVQAAWHLFEDVSDPEATSTVGAVFASADGASHLLEDSEAAGTPGDAPPLAP
ncbi:MAG: alkaline phosphatase D family protein [Myxococcota bacterium]